MSVGSWMGGVLISFACGCGEHPTRVDSRPPGGVAFTTAAYIRPDPAPIRAELVPVSMNTVGVDHLCVTSGAMTSQAPDRFTVVSPTFRAVAPGSSLATPAELHFTFLGPSAETAALGSGAIRRQLGLKLLAQDPCNLVYVMWRLEPESKLVVSVKRNPASRTSAECGNRGYTNVMATASAPLPPVTAGSSHVLRAELEGSTLSVIIDGKVSWRGSLSADALSLQGPVGVRTDNVRVDGELRATMRPGSSDPCDARKEGPD